LIANCRKASWYSTESGYQWNKSTDSLEIMANVRCIKNAFGIETLKITTDIYKLEQFQKKTLKQFLGLPQQTADPAIYMFYT
jgi:predicted restriction endonuclease